MFNDRKHTARYIWHPDDHLARRLQDLHRRRLNLEAWLEMILIVLTAVLAYAIFAGPVR
jgi:hypothetical protein